MKIILSLSLFLFSIGSFAKEDNTAKIEKFIQDNDRVLVHVHADWCPSCKAQKKVLDKIGLPNFKLLEVDFDSDKKFLAAKT